MVEGEAASELWGQVGPGPGEFHSSTDWGGPQANCGGGSPDSALARLQIKLALPTSSQTRALEFDRILSQN